MEAGITFLDSLDKEDGWTPDTTSQLEAALAGGMREQQQAFWDAWSQLGLEPDPETDAFPSLRATVVALLVGVQAVHGAAVPQQRVPEDTFHLPALNATLRAIMATAWPGDGGVASSAARAGVPQGLMEGVAHALYLGSLEAADTATRAAASTGSLTAALHAGLSLNLLDGVTKGMLAYGALYRSLAAGSGSVNVRGIAFTANRERAFEDAYEHFRSKGLPPFPAQPSNSADNADKAASDDGVGSAAILSPQFFRNFAAGGGPGIGGAAVDEGEGHGPRKEFFAVASQQLDKARLPGKRGHGVLHGRAGSNTVIAPEMGEVRHGDTITVPAADTGAVVVLQATVVASLSATELALSKYLKQDLNGVTYSIARPTEPLLSYRQGAEGYEDVCVCGA